MQKYVYDFIEGDRSRADLLGGKGANLAEMTRLGLPVPPGFTVSTDACRVYLATGAPPAGLFEEVKAHLREVEARLGRRLGDPHRRHPGGRWRRRRSRPPPYPRRARWVRCWSCPARRPRRWCR
ncbi:Pyruvate phosphate dikinase, PEP/pyruvate binding domain [Micromonospora mirobrigensis]|uniref:Pyruvate phosphate dikinase, PEP/pyruvate binding domain n=1 Tax=Micromonospora mirobrigensis TaxID=262898 RepID=A0A1C4ZIF1_9ACTN|nr:Pyruvate phosphate dikinase, PEP/pyruvate binding domain [Micromonospora mirobrigensis]